MIISEFESYEDLREHFSYHRAWDLVDSPRETLNVTEECIDRHSGPAVRTMHPDGSTDEYSFEEISKRAAQFSHYLEDGGVEKGDRVAIMLSANLEYLASFFGTIKRGAVAVPCSELFGPDALEYRLDDWHPPLLVSTREIIESISTDFDAYDISRTLAAEELLIEIDGYPTEYVADTSDEDDCWVQYTSGTTGRPDGETYQHKSIPYNAIVKDLILDLGPGDSSFTTSSPGWGAGVWSGLFTPLLFGMQTGFKSGQFDPDVVLDAFDTFEVTTLMGVVPTALSKIVSAARGRDDPPQLEKITYAGEPMDARLSREVTEVLGAFPRSYYGATELRSIVAADFSVTGYDFRHGSMGKPLPSIDVKIVDDDGEELPHGEVGTLAMRRGDEWVETGDAASMDPDGYLWSAGRADDTILSAGYTIGPQEVEETLRSHPAVLESGVIGVPDEERGQIVKAFVSTTVEPSAELEAELREYVKSELSKHEYPREIEFLDEIPQTPDGKIKRPDLRKLEEIS